MAASRGGGNHQPLHAEHLLGQQVQPRVPQLPLTAPERTFDYSPDDESSTLENSGA